MATKTTTKEIKATKAAPVKKAGVKAVMFSAKGEKSEASLSEAIFGQKANGVLIAQAARVFLSNQRSAQAKTKGRGEVRYTTAKVYRQKGTGHARHGDKGAPIFVGGGIAHGPNGIQNYKKDLSKVLKKKALVSALSAVAQKGKVVLADLTKIEAKTKSLNSFIKKMDLKYPAVLVYGEKGNIERAGRNLSGVTLVPANQVTAYQILSGKQLVLTTDALEVLEKRALGGKNVS